MPPLSKTTSNKSKKSSPVRAKGAAKAKPSNGVKHRAQNGVKAKASAASKRIYFFGGGKAEGNKEMKNLLGGKGANLAEMTNIGVPVPPGFTITTDVCTLFYKGGRKLP